MVLLCLIEPQGKFETMVQNIKLHYNYPTLLPDVDLYEQLHLGEEAFPVLRGPTPTELVPARIVPTPVIPGPDFVRPVHTRPSPMANDPNNYRM